MSQTTKPTTTAGVDDRLQRLAEVIPMTYDELRSLASDLLRRHRRVVAKDATSLVHDACARLAEGDAPFSSEKHFLHTAVRAMRFVLVDRLRRDRAQKRGGGRLARPLTTDALAVAAAPSLLEIDEVLTRLAAVDPGKASLVELRFFGRLTIEEAAAALSISVATAKRDWALARAWLLRELDPR